jgi:hypothetical protein
MNNNYYEPHLEWEAVAFPLILENPQFEDAAYVFDGPSSITLWREVNLQLKATMQGRMKNPKMLDDEREYGRGNMVKQSIINAYDTMGNKAILTGCVLGGYRFKSDEVNEDGYLVNMELVFDTATLTKLAASPDQHFEWFLVQNFDAHLYGTTRRSLQTSQKKIRVGVDLEEPNDRLSGSSVSRDYFVLEQPGFSCIIARVPPEFTGKKMAGLCIEFRGTEIEKMNPELLHNLKGLLSILLGGKLYFIGYSKIAKGELVESFLDSPDIPLKLPVAMPPIHYNMQYDWGNFALQTNLLFPQYQALQEILFLNNAVDRYWISQTVPIGANLPILAGGLEVIANAYLKMAGNNQVEYMPQPDYEDLIGQELLIIAAKLGSVKDGDKMFNKIKGAFRKGSNEKINLFFDLLDLNIDRSEKEAIKLRNKMTHSTRDYTIEENAHDDVIATRVYQALFNRIFLKILGYQGYYIDYSLKGSPSKQI